MFETVRQLAGVARTRLSVRARENNYAGVRIHEPVCVSHCLTVSNRVID
jgi:hypothetical protein